MPFASWGKVPHDVPQAPKCTQLAVPFTFLFYPAFLQEHCHLWLWHPTHHLWIHVAVSSLKGKSPIVSHLLHRGKDKFDRVFLPLFKFKDHCSLSRQYCQLYSLLWCHSSKINQPVLTLETYPEFTCKQLKSCQYLRPAWKERAGQWLTQSKKNPSNNKRDLRQANIFILF